MKHKFFIVLAICAGSISSFAQNSKVTTGVIAYQQQDYEKAISSLDEALKNPSSLKEKNIPKAYFYRGNSLFQLYQKAAREKDETTLQKYNDAFLRACDDFQKASESEEGDWNAKARSQLALLRPSLLQEGMSLLNLTNQKDISESEKLKALQFAENYLTRVVAIEEDYLGHDLLGQVYYQKTDFEKALNYFVAAEKQYQSNPPQYPDFLIAYVFYRAGTIYRYYRHDQSDELASASSEDLDNALQSIQNGNNLLKTEYERFKKLNPGLNVERSKNMEQQYQNAKNALNRFELDIYLNVPDKYDDAVEKFRKAVEAEPNNYLVLVAYAQLLEASDMKTAIEVYEKAISIDDSQLIAQFNLGAIYVNRAAEFSREANNQENFDEAEKFNQQSLEQLRKAKPYMENALKSSPNDLTIVNALLQICVNLGDDECYQKYKALKLQNEGN